MVVIYFHDILGNRDKLNIFLQPETSQWKIACTKQTHIFVINSYGPFIFKSNAWKNIW